MAISPARTLAAGSPDPGIGRSDGAGGVVLWDIAVSRRLAGAPLFVKDGRVAAVAFTPDGKSLAAGFGHRGDEDVPADAIGGVRVVPDAVGGVMLWDTPASRSPAD